MRIGLNCLYLIPEVVGGTETYAKGLLSGFSTVDSSNEFVVFVSREAKNWSGIPKNFQRIVCDVSATNRGKRYLYEQTVLPGQAKKHRLDVLHSLGYTSPLRIPCKSVVTIHDLNFIAFARQMSPLRKIALGSIVRFGARTSDHVIAVSEFSRKEILRLLHISPEKVSVVHEASDPQKMARTNTETLLKRFGIDRPYWVAFSSVSPNKNIPHLLKALAIIRREFGLRNQLVLVGHRPETEAGIHDAPHDHIVFTGYLADNEVSSLLSEAQMMIFPSLYEGFGLPIVEAMALGVPVTCSTAASLPEIAGDAALFFNPHFPNDIAEKISILANDKDVQESLRRKGFENVKRFSWLKAATETIKVYHQVLNKSLKIENSSSESVQL